MGWVQRQINSVERSWKKWRRKKPAPPRPMKTGPSASWWAAFTRRFRRPAATMPQQVSLTPSFWKRLRRTFGWGSFVGFVKSTPIAAPVAYWKTRSLRRLALGVPAVAALVALVWVGVAVGRQNYRDVAHWYAEQAEAQKTTNKPLALAYAEAAAQKNPDRPEYQYQLAILARDSGDLSRWLSILSTLAPLNNVDQRGFPLAHLELANYYLQPPLTRENTRLAEKHLLRIVDTEGRIGYEACDRLGDFYVYSGQPLKALPYYRRLPSQSLGRVKLAHAAMLAGEEATALEEAKLCVEWLEGIVDANPNDYRARVLLVQSLMVARKFQLGVAAANKGLELNEKDEQLEKSLKEARRAGLRRIRADVYYDWLTSLEKKKAEGTSPLRLSVLEAALADSPEDRRLLNKLMEFVDPYSEDGAKARTLLNRQLADGKNLPLAHFVAGCFAWREHDEKQAIIHFKQANELLPNNSFILNNLAYVMAIAEKPDFDAALRLSDAAIKQDDKMEFRHTRGLILSKMQRWDDAIRDLELSLRGVKGPDLVETHRLLGQAYEALGNNELAALHREKLKDTGAEKKK